jgi:UBX domain-containing protein 1
LLTKLQAERYLAAGNWNIETAAALFFEQADPAEEEQSDADVDMAGDEPTNPTPNPAQQQQPGGGRTLDGTYVPPAAGSSSSSQPAAPRQPQRGLRTLGDLQSSGGGGHGHSHDDDDDDEQDDENQDFFAGGEKSGLAVQNPNQSNPRDHINNILRRARQ